VNGTLDFNQNAFNGPANNQGATGRALKVILHVNQAPRNLFGTSMGTPAVPASTDLFARVHTHAGTTASFGSKQNRRRCGDINSPLHIRNYWAWHRSGGRARDRRLCRTTEMNCPSRRGSRAIAAITKARWQERPNERPWSLHRNGFAGVQRYGRMDLVRRRAVALGHTGSARAVGVNYSLSLTPFWAPTRAASFPLAT